MSRIIICVTLRDFDGSQNDAIQRNFLDSILIQNYKNYILAVTLFDERFVKKEIEARGINAVFYNSKLPKFSITEVISNGLMTSTLPTDIILWTTADNVLSNNFFDVVATSVRNRSIGISYPQGRALLDSLKHKSYMANPAYIVPDLIFSTVDNFDDGYINLLKDDPIIGPYPGIYQLLLMGYSRAYHMINIFPAASYYSIENPAEVKYNGKVVSDATNINSRIANKIFEAVKLRKKYYKDSFLINRKAKSILPFMYVKIFNFFVLRSVFLAIFDLRYMPLFIYVKNFICKNIQGSSK